MTCLVQQLFRQKIGKEPDQRLIDEVLFPLLRSMKHGPRELLLDVKLTRSICTSRNAVDAKYNPLPGDPPFPFVTKILPFEKELYQSSAAAILRGDKSPGKVPSSLRRMRHMGAWGTIDILNELRSIKSPNIDYFPPTNPQWGEDHFEDIFIQFEEEAPQLPSPCYPPSCKNNAEFVNEFLEDALTNGKRLSFGGDPAEIRSRKILSTYY
jgi:hypothetical protein